MNCCYCGPKLISKAICNICKDIPQPFSITGTVTCDGVSVTIPQPLEVSGTITCEGSTVTVDIPQPLNVTGTLNVANECVDELSKQLETSSSYTELVLSNGEQFQKITDLKIVGELAFFSSQGQQVIVPVCNIEYVVQ